MYAHKEISHKVHGPNRSENARHLLEWVYCERCVHILYAFWAYYTQCLCWFCTAKSFLSSAITLCHVLITQNAAHALESKSCACVVRTWLRFATERKKKRSRIFNSGVSFGKLEQLAKWETKSLRGELCEIPTTFVNNSMRRLGHRAQK